MAYRYYIGSARLNEAQFAEAVGGHWEIENSLHWVLDTSVKEDDCQIYKDDGAESMGILRHISLNMLRAESTKASMPTKRKRTWMKTQFLEQLLQAGLSQLNKKRAVMRLPSLTWSVCLMIMKIRTFPLNLY